MAATFITQYPFQSFTGGTDAGFSTNVFSDGLCARCCVFLHTGFVQKQHPMLSYETLARRRVLQKQVLAVTSSEEGADRATGGFFGLFSGEERDMEPNSTS